MDGCTKGSPLHWKLLKPYAEVDSKPSMVVIQCPHCGEDVELEDGASGLFDCPHCEQDFSYGDYDNALPRFHRSQLFMSMGMKIGLAIMAISVITFIVLAIVNYGESGQYSGMWIFIPCGILVIGIPIVVISFFVRGYQLNWEL